MSKGKPGKPKWIVSDWIDLDDDQTWLTLIAVTGWILLLVIVMLGW